MRNMKLAATAAGLTGQVFPALFRVHAHVHAVHGPRKDYPRGVCHFANPVWAKRWMARDVSMSLDMRPLLHASRHSMRGAPKNHIAHLQTSLPMQLKFANAPIADFCIRIPSISSTNPRSLEQISTNALCSLHKTRRNLSTSSYNGLGIKGLTHGTSPRPHHHPQPNPGQLQTELQYEPNGSALKQCVSTPHARVCPQPAMHTDPGACTPKLHDRPMRTTRPHTLPLSRKVNLLHCWKELLTPLLPTPPSRKKRQRHKARRRRHRGLSRHQGQARHIAAERLWIKMHIIYTTSRRWGQSAKIRHQLHRLTRRWKDALSPHPWSSHSPVGSRLAHMKHPYANAPRGLDYGSPLACHLQHLAPKAAPCACHANPMETSHKSGRADQPCISPAASAAKSKTGQGGTMASTQAKRQPSTTIPATGTSSDIRVSALPCASSASAETLSNAFHTPVTTGVARQIARNGHPASFGTHPTTQKAMTDLLAHLTVSLIPNEESGTVTVEFSAPITHALQNMPPKSSQAHAQGGTNKGGGAPNLLGGAGCMYSAAVTREMDDALVTHGLWADWNYQWIEGDCGFDSLSSLSGVPSSAIRNNAMDILSSRLANGSEDTTNIEGFIQEMISEHKERGGCEDLNGTNYIANMRKGARAGGLWMDNLVAGLAGEALEANIEIYEYADRSIKPQGGSAQNPQWPTYRLLYTRGPPGHFTPLSRLPTPAQTTVHTHTQPSHAYPGHSAPDLAVQHHRLPQAIRHFWEKQDRRFCWLHAFNMARKACMDQDSITPSDIIHWFTTEQQFPRYEHHRTLLNDTNPNTRPFDPLSGNFNQCAFAFWAFLTQLARISHVPMPQRPSPELNVDSLVAFLTQTLADLQHYNESTLPAFILVTREHAGYGHATTLIYDDSTWYWLDSDPTKLYRAILTGPAAEPNRKELLTVARSLYSIDHGAHGLHDCPLACDLFSPNPPAPWHLPPIVIPDSPILTSGRAHANAQPHAGAPDLPPLGPPPWPSRSQIELPRQSALLRSSLLPPDIARTLSRNPRPRLHGGPKTDPIGAKLPSQ